MSGISGDTPQKTSAIVMSADRYVFSPNSNPGLNREMLTITDNGSTATVNIKAKNIWLNSAVISETGRIAANTDKAQITSYTTGWTSYSSAVIPTVYRFGQVVVLSGQMKNTAAKTLDTDETTIFTIPTGYRPPQQIDVLCQGSSKNIFKCRVNTDGTVQFSRYRTGDGTYASISAGAWLPFHITWIVPRTYEL